LRQDKKESGGTTKCVSCHWYMLRGRGKEKTWGPNFQDELVAQNALGKRSRARGVLRSEEAAAWGQNMNSGKRVSANNTKENVSLRTGKGFKPRGRQTPDGLPAGREGQRTGKRATGNSKGGIV